MRARARSGRAAERWSLRSGWTGRPLVPRLDEVEHGLGKEAGGFEDLERFEVGIFGDGQIERPLIARVERPGQVNAAAVNREGDVGEIDRAVVGVLPDVKHRHVLDVELRLAARRLKQDVEVAKGLQQVCLVEQIARDDADVGHYFAPRTDMWTRSASS